MLSTLNGTKKLMFLTPKRYEHPRRLLYGEGVGG